MNSSTITCPHCGKNIELTEALTGELQRHIKSELTKKHDEELVIARKQIEMELKVRLDQEMGVEIIDLKNQLTEKNEKVKKYQEYELKLREEKRIVEERQKELSIEVGRKLDEEKKKLEEVISKQAAEEYRLKNLDKEKKISDMEKLIEELKRRAQQGSQQLQGEVQELDLEEILRSTFLSDTIEPIGKGVRGADIRQIVKTSLGNICGVILWESKRTKAWADEWIGKLKEDLRSEKANIPIIVSSVLPQEAKNGFGQKDGVLVCSYLLMIPIAELLRQKLIDSARDKFISQNKGEKAEALYAYITSHEFKQQVEALAEVYQDMKQQIDRERIAFEKIWKTREAQVLTLYKTTASIVGSMRGTIGQAMATLKGIDLFDEGVEEQKLLE